MSVWERPAPRWCHAATGLRDFALITWAVEPQRLAARLPAGFTADLYDDHGLVSMVAFLDDRFHFRAAPFLRVSCGQVNYRTYVRRAGKTGVWFFGTSLDSILVALPRVVWKMPWHRSRLRLMSSWDDRQCQTWRLTAAGGANGWGDASVALRGTGRALPRPQGFADADQVSRVLFDPFVGWYGRRDGSGVGKYTVWHQPLALEEAIADDTYCRVFTDLGLIEPGQAPVSAGIQRVVTFDVHTPPVRD